MKGFRNIVMLVLLAGWQLSTVYAQDLQIISQRELVGTARYVGMAGAMTAVGGDPSAVRDNPAAAGVFRRMDIQLTFDMSFDRVNKDGPYKSTSQYNVFTATQASVLFSMRNRNGSKGLLFNNMMLSYHRLASFNRRYTVSQDKAPWSLSDVIALKTDGLVETALQPAERWDDAGIGWLSCQGYDTWLVSPSASDPTLWLSVLEEGQTVKNNFTITETGYLNEYSLTWGGNLSNRLFLGVSLNILSLYHNQTVLYYEEFGEGCGLDNNTYVAHSALGFNAALGVIYHPLRWLRLGASFTTPSAMTLTTTTYGTLSSTLWFPNEETDVYELKGFASESPTNRYTDRSMTQPLRLSLGVAFQCLNYGLLSLQYDYSHNKNINDVHAMRVGIEGVITNHFFLEAGYAYESSFAKSEAVQLLNTTVRTDAYSQWLNGSQYVTAGFGYRATHFNVHAAYRLRMQRFDTYAHELADPYHMQAMTHSLVITLGFHTK